MCTERLFGVRITLDRLFLLLLFVLALIGLLPEALIVFGIVVVHELAHAAVARSHGLRVIELELLPFGGVARIDGVMEVDPNFDKNVDMAGPMTNLFMLGLGVVAKTYALYPEQWLDFFIQTNATLALFNALPALPLDGGRVYRAHLVGRLGFRRATEKAASLGRLLAVLLGIAGLAGVYFGYFNATLPVLGVFLFSAATRERANAMYVLLRYLARKQDEFMRSGCLASEQLVAATHARVADVVRLFIPQRYHLIWIVDEKGGIEGLVTELDVINTLFEQGSDTPVHLLLDNRNKDNQTS